MFNTILIANRGEIACRVIRTAKRMGIKTVAIYSKVDQHSLHVQMADLAFCVGQAQAKDSYLNIDRIIQIALESGAQAIHPGYGFLSENAPFAKACEKAGIVFIGPSVEAIEAMASKQLAKQMLENTSVPLTPGYHGLEQTPQHLLLEARRIGFPVLIKAANGGGGKGMRAVFEEAEFESALAGAKRESLASFADDTMIIEKLIQNPRHVEVQIMADTLGNVVHLFERDCSIQRRHQKIIEEAPAPDLPEELRQKLAKAACEVASSIHYKGAGTVEFLVDASGHFYFMEMNTRLQVEHPVTECITGLDLVAWQLKIASGEPLPLKQEEILAQGHAIECRIYAEDPANGFIPSIGLLDFLKEPFGEGIRIDTGVELHSTISMYYDPMIAKLICWGKSREEALLRMQQALAQYCIGGVKTNIAFLQAICKHPNFIEAKLSTDFLDQENISLPCPNKELALLMAISFDYLQTLQTIADPLFKDTFAWPMQRTSQWVWRYQIDAERHDALIHPLDNSTFEISLGDKKHKIAATLSKDKLSIETNDRLLSAVVENNNQQITFYTEHGPMTVSRFNWAKLDAHAGAKGQLTAPMPATVVAILKQVGEAVKTGDKLIVLEAMKMEHTIHAPSDGMLSAIFYEVGAQVHEGAELLSLSE